MTGSTAGLSGVAGYSQGSLGYVASKHGVVGLRAYAKFRVPCSIPVNAIHSIAVSTGIIDHKAVRAFVQSSPSVAGGLSDALPSTKQEPEGTSEAGGRLVSEDAGTSRG